MPGSILTRVRQYYSAIWWVAAVSSIVFVYFVFSRSSGPLMKTEAATMLVLGMTNFVLLMRVVHRNGANLRWLENVTIRRLDALEASSDPTSPSTVLGEKGPWPWGGHTTSALSDLEAAAKRFWSNYDPSDPSSAPTNRMVTDWLISERLTSANNAQAIASILRADGLKPGPRR